MAKSDEASVPDGSKRPLLALLRQTGDALEAAAPPFDADSAAAQLAEAARTRGLLPSADMPEDYLAIRGTQLEEGAPSFDVEAGADRLRQAAVDRGLLAFDVPRHSVNENSESEGQYGDRGDGGEEVSERLVAAVDRPQVSKKYVDAGASLIKRAAKVGVKARSALGQAGSNAASDYSAGRGARRGILAPGDPSPPPDAGGSYYDFRGVLSLPKVPPEYQAAEFPLGRYVDPAKGPRQPIGLPSGALETHAAVVAPTGSGKTTSIIVPWIVAGLRAGWSVVTIDAKGDLADRVKQTVRASGQRLGVPIRVLDYTNPAISAKWNWCAELDSDEAISSAVDAIVGKECPEHTAKTFWLRDKRILRGLFEMVMASPHRDQVTAELLLNILRDQDKLAKNLQRYPSSPASGRLKSLLQLSQGKYAEEIADIENKLDVLTTPKLKALTGQAGMRAVDVLRAPSFVSVVAPLHHGDMASMLSGLFINQVLSRAYDRYTNPGGVPLLLVFDEAAELKNRVDFKSLLSIARAAQVAALIAVQDVTQFDDKNRSVVFGNCGTLVYLPGTTYDSAKYLSDQLGQHPVQTRPAVSGWRDQRTDPRQTSMVPVLGTREIRDLPFGRFAAVVHSRPMTDRPFLVDLAMPHS